MKYVIPIFLATFFIHCTGNDKHQVVVLKNLSPHTVYFVLSPDSFLRAPGAIARIRPSVYPGGEKDTASTAAEIEARQQSLFRYQIQKGKSAVILSSEAAGIFVDKISIKSIIRDRYQGKAHVFLIRESHLKKYSDEVIINKKLYDHFHTITEDEIATDTTVFEYR
jgi:hypothetical protein